MGVRKIAYIHKFLVKNRGANNMGVKRQNVLVKRILLSFPQFVSDVAVILHEVQQCPQIFLYYMKCFKKILFTGQTEF